MKLGGRCPLNISEENEKRKYLNDELGKIYPKENFEGKSLEVVERMYCFGICQNGIC